MERLVNSFEMKEIEALICQNEGIDEHELTTRAAAAAFDVICSDSFDTSRILIVCGSGNNGGDGLALAAMLYRCGYDVRVYCCAKGKRSAENDARYRECAGIGVRFIYELSNAIYRPTVLVDALFGTGLSRNVEGEYADIITYINSCGAKILSLDIPSGISADSGAMLGVAVCADATVAFGALKIGHILYPGTEYAGALTVADIGSFFKRAELRLVEKKDISEIPGRRAYSNKGTYGKVFIIAGGVNMAGAAYLSALAAYRSGAGLVKVCTVEENRSIIQTLIPEAVLMTYDKNAPDIYGIIQEMNGCDVCVIGPGIGRSAISARIVASVLSSSKVPLIIDADALNIISDSPDMLRYIKCDAIVTPHIGEMSRLCKAERSDIASDIIEYSKRFAKEHGVCCVLKDARTITALLCGEVFVNSTGNNGMATAGSGDVLTGIIAALIAQGADISKAAYLGVCIHGAAGDAAMADKGEYGMMASDIASNIPTVLKNINE